MHKATIIYDKIINIETHLNVSAFYSNLSEVMTIVVVITKGRGGIDWPETGNQWVVQYKLASVVDDTVIYYKGPLDDGMVLRLLGLALF